MNKCKNFLDYFDFLVSCAKEPITIPKEVQEFYDMLREQQEQTVDKPLFTDMGLQILEYIQASEAKNHTAKDIATGMDISSRRVSGAMRKLMTDGFVEKLFNKSPAVYALTEQGRKFNIEEYKKEN